MSPVLTGDIMVLVQQVAAAAYMEKAHRDHRRAFLVSGSPLFCVFRRGLRAAEVRLEVVHHRLADAGVQLKVDLDDLQLQLGGAVLSGPG